MIIIEGVFTYWIYIALAIVIIAAMSSMLYKSVISDMTASIKQHKKTINDLQERITMSTSNIDKSLKQLDEIIHDKISDYFLMKLDNSLGIRDSKPTLLKDVDAQRIMNHVFTDLVGQMSQKYTKYLQTFIKKESFNDYVVNRIFVKTTMAVRMYNYRIMRKRPAGKISDMNKELSDIPDKQ